MDNNSEFDFYTNPPWKYMEGLDPFSVPWKQGMYEPYMNEWWTFWQTLSPETKQVYLENAPLSWREYLDFVEETAEDGE